MRARRLIAVAGVVALGLLGAWLWFLRSPLELTLVNAEPAHIKDDAGKEMVLATLRVRNRDSVSVELASDMTLEARVADRWLAVTERFHLRNPLPPGTNSESLFLLPAGASAFRVRLKYQSEMFKWRVWQSLPASAMRKIADSPRLRKALWPQGNTMRRPPEWKEVTLEAAVKVES